MLRNSAMIRSAVFDLRRGDRRRCVALTLGMRQRMPQRIDLRFEVC
jgi:hypothetical protein